MKLSRPRRLALLLAAPAVMLALAVPAASASTATRAAPDANVTICANGGAGLCLQNNGSLGSLVANDKSNGGTTQEYTIGDLGVTAHGAPGSGGYPFSTAALNDSVTAGREVLEIGSVEAGEAYCIDVNEGTIDVNDCYGSQSEWVATGSGRLVSVGASDQNTILAFASSDGVNGGNPVTSTDNACPEACWSSI